MRGASPADTAPMPAPPAVAVAGAGWAAFPGWRCCCWPGAGDAAAAVGCRRVPAPAPGGGGAVAGADAEAPADAGRGETSCRGTFFTSHPPTLILAILQPIRRNTFI